MAKRETAFSHALSTPGGTCFFYSLAAGILIVIYRFVFSGLNAAPPLACFTVGIALAKGAVDFCYLFPAIYMSALALPFGKMQKITKKYSVFSTEFLEMLKPSIISAVFGTVVFALLFLIVRPLAADYLVDVRVKTALFNSSLEKARQFAAEENYDEAAHFLSFCDRIWSKAPNMETLRDQVIIAQEKKIYSRSSGGNSKSGAQIMGLPGQKTPLSAAEALRFSERAYNEKRYYDAHYLANLASHLASDGSAESTLATIAASKAWNAISRLEPSSEEENQAAIYHEKRAAYEALQSGDWIGAYYSFSALIKKIPNDPDTQNYLKISQEGLKKISFFFDELDTHAGDELSETVFSIPISDNGGRMVIRFNSLTCTADFVYGKSIEIAAFNEMRRPIYRITSPYVKLLPVNIGGRERTIVYLHSLDRNNEKLDYKPTWKFQDAQLSKTLTSDGGENQILLDIPFDQFLLASVAGGNYEDFFLRDLFESASTLQDYGYVSEVFQAEVLHNINEPLLFLPLAILALILGWSLRARGHAPYVYFPMMVVMPILFNSLVFILREIVYDFEILLLMSLSFTAAIAVSIITAVVLFFVFLLILSAQH
ncbi:MAG: hypothetical protein Ta2B_14850 [Termitinemataceae bacterium]|nr:MAG: hypothetical protein Ta2B_14850 [Termitinemataceae bacterium]